jgi:Ca2+-binding EF-hand superfamily protein
VRGPVFDRSFNHAARRASDSPPRSPTLPALLCPASAPRSRKAMLRAQEMAKKNEKRTLCEVFAGNLELRLPELQRSFQRFRRMPCFKSGRATFEEMCSMFDIDEDNEFRDIYTVFGDFTQGGRVNVRELLLALSMFTPGTTKPQRINFTFFVFDADASGEISVDELSQILQASHLSNDADAARKKAESILGQADKDSSGSISLEEFVVLANRFPNIIFPNYSQTAEEAMHGRGPAANAASRAAAQAALDATAASRKARTASRKGRRSQKKAAAGGDDDEESEEEDE